MQKVTVTTRLAVPAEDVWRLVGGWNALPQWHPAVQTSVLEAGGEQRRLHLADGSEFVERLEQHDDENRRYTYSIVTSPLPLTDYRATLQVLREGTQSTLEWTSTFSPANATAAELTKVIEAFYESGFSNLRRLLRA